MGDVIELLTTATNTVEVEAQGPQGIPGVGVPTGGSALQVLRKKTSTDYDTEWAAAGSGSGSVTSVALASTDFTITGSPITTSGTITANIAANAVTLEKLQTISSQHLLGRHGNGNGGVQQVGLGTGLAMSGSNVGVTFGSSAGTACQGNDSRLSDPRQPLSHAASHASAGSDPLFDQDLNTTDNPTFVDVYVGSLTADGASQNPPTADSCSVTPQGFEFIGTAAATTRTNLGLGTAATAATGDFAAASHTHELTALAATGATNGHVLTANGSNGVTFAALPASGVTGAASSASDVLGVSGSNITGVDANADRIVYWNNTSNKLAYGTPADAGAAAASHTHAASDVTSGTFDNARINFAAPAAIGNTTPQTGAFTSLSTAPATNTSAFTTTGYSLTGSNAQSLVDLAGTWNTTGTPSAIKLNVTDTASNASSLLMQLQTGGANRFTVAKNGNLSITPASGESQIVGNSGGLNISVGGNQFTFWSTSFFLRNAAMVMGGVGGGTVGRITMASTGFVEFGETEAALIRDGSHVIAQRRTTTAQESRLYATYTSDTNYQRMTIKSVKQTLSALSGASATTTGTFIPDGAVVVGVTTRVATALTGATGYTIGDGTDADRWGDITGTAIGTTSDNRDWTAGTIECFTAGGEITLTAKTSNFTAGAIEICVFYLAGQAD